MQELAITCEPVRGQKLFIRPIEPPDSELVRAFLDRHAPGTPRPSAGLIGKLVGEVAAVLAMEITDESLRIVDLVVAEELRRKRVGRIMIDELAQLAGKMERSWLEVDPRGARRFFERVGFSGDPVMRRRA